MQSFGKRKSRLTFWLSCVHQSSVGRSKEPAGNSGLSRRTPGEFVCLSRWVCIQYSVLPIILIRENRLICLDGEMETCLLEICIIMILPCRLDAPSSAVIPKRDGTCWSITCLYVTIERRMRTTEFWEARAVTRLSKLGFLKIPPFVH